MYEHIMSVLVSEHNLESSFNLLFSYICSLNRHEWMYILFIICLWGVLIGNWLTQISSHNESVWWNSAKKISTAKAMASEMHDVMSMMMW